MKTLDQAIEKLSADHCLDGRDVVRLAEFVPADRMPELGLTLKDEYKDKHVPEEWDRRNIIAKLEKDVEFGFEKALDQRGISASLMCDVVKMWNWILEEGLEDWPDLPDEVRETLGVPEGADYAMYGLPVFKATAVKYGFPNPIGDDTGMETKYETD